MPSQVYRHMGVINNHLDHFIELEILEELALVFLELTDLAEKASQSIQQLHIDHMDSVKQHLPRFDDPLLESLFRMRERYLDKEEIEARRNSIRSYYSRWWIMDPAFQDWKAENPDAFAKFKELNPNLFASED